MRRVQLFNWLLIAVNIGLAYRLVAAWWPHETPSLVSEKGVGKPVRLDIPHTARRPPAKGLAATIGDKDLFTEDRSASHPAESATSEEARPLNVSLMGVVAHGGKRVALVSEQGQPKPVWLREGEDVGGNVLESIGADSVVFATSGGGKVTVELKVQESTKAAVASAKARRRARPPTKPRATPRRGPRSQQIKAKIQKLRAEARARRESRLKAARDR